MPGLLSPRMVMLLGQASSNRYSYSNLFLVGLTFVLLQKLSAANVTACPSSSLSAAVWPMPLLHLAKDCCASCAAVLMWLWLSW